MKPESAAKREIYEETTLDDNDITLLRRGKPFSLIDKKLKTEWTIHPFAWQLRPDAKPIKFDWEHTEYRFVKPEDLGKYDHVPQLEIGMERVLVSEETESGLKVLMDDHESGAQALAVKALEILLAFVRGEKMAKLGDPEEFWKELRWGAWHLAKNGRPNMGSAIEAELFKALDSSQKQVEESGGVRAISLAPLRAVVESSIETRIAARHDSLQNIANHFVKFIDTNRPRERKDRPSSSRHIVTLSSSGTITQCFRSVIEHAVEKGTYLKLSVLESRPRFEGVSFVSTLLEPFRNDPAVLSKIEIEIVSDASIATVLEEADYLVLGGDKVLPNGDVSNKIGSLTAALLVRTMENDCRTVAVFDSGKVGWVADLPETEYNDPAELTDAWPSKTIAQLKKDQAKGFNIQVKNAYFEWVPHGYIDQYITERGPLDENGIGELAVESEALEKRIFSDL
jgi:translation initiation factor 2B subunit (eIF-2B alpha/beta/delta family)